MAAIVKLKRSNISGRSPTTSMLDVAELALNTADKKLYSSDGTNIFTIGSVLPSLTIGDYQMPTTDGQNGHVLATDGSGQVSFVPANIEAITSTSVTTAYQSYYYTATANQTTFSGADNNSQTLAYDIGRVEVYYNGVRLITGTDYTANTKTSIVLNSGAVAGADLEIVAVGYSGQIQIGSAASISHSQIVSTNTSQVTLDEFDVLEYRSQHYYVEASSTSGGVHTTMINILHHGGTVYLNEFGSMMSGNILATYDSDISSAKVRLRATPVSSGVTINAKRTGFLI